MNCVEGFGLSAAGSALPRARRRWFHYGWVWKILELIAFTPASLLGAVLLVMFTANWLERGTEPPEYLAFGGFLAGIIFLALLQLTWRVLALLRDALERAAAAEAAAVGGES